MVKKPPIRSTAPPIGLQFGQPGVPEVHPHLVKAILSNKDVILNGSVLSIDPSSGSRESLPGWAQFEAGHLIGAGQLQVPIALMKGINYTPHRLQWIGTELRKLHSQHYDLLIMECIHYRPNEKTNLKSFQQLNQAIGAITSNLAWTRILQVLPVEWKKFTNGFKGYQKGDVSDAVQIGQTVIYLARNLG